ncbi:UDP-N-acetylmuramoyl-L-alanyl-D-glutamate--2,6-diaminopimelate ligase domain protein [Mycobacterium xenopi 4042]|uniref:UDP-N-acetylmuramoyl-L-alanyl-D-glutamate--2, 6-diaminopimelate ligase domain protein n=1 Tax=Mycobacterium xenopi 4042 TaxID=1299334 RepID=X7ZXI1_MYCXE|nr:UDP-N-acetylmuramoyl-L-alanyl-D-glutamate--2,6-diaminopimelate ligase domain protein [Mycobacterium xenopi 4042]
MSWLKSWCLMAAEGGDVGAFRAAARVGSGVPLTTLAAQAGAVPAEGSVVPDLRISGITLRAKTRSRATCSRRCPARQHTARGMPVRRSNAAPPRCSPTPPGLARWVTTWACRSSSTPGRVRCSANWPARFTVIPPNGFRWSA